MSFSSDDLRALLTLNELRQQSTGSAERDALEDRFSSRFGADRRLAVYGSLAPGRSNHHQLASLRGEWVPGLSARGELLDRGWAASEGYPALRWSMDGVAVPVELFLSDELTDHWPRLDVFEGEEYQRILVPLFQGERVVTVANLYAMASL